MIEITQNSKHIPLTVCECTVESIGDNYVFNCPCCEDKLTLHYTLLATDEFNESVWMGNCPVCKVELIFDRPD